MWVDHFSPFKGGHCIHPGMDDQSDINDNNNEKLFQEATRHCSMISKIEAFKKRQNLELQMHATFEFTSTRAMFQKLK